MLFIALQGQKAHLEEDLKQSNKRIAQLTKTINQTEESLNLLRAKESELQEELTGIKSTWVSAEESRKLRQTAQKCQERELELSQRLATVSDDFCYLMERSNAVESELKLQQKWRSKVVALQRAMEAIMNSVCALEKRCCEVQPLLTT